MSDTYGLSLDPNPTVTGYVIWKNELPLDWGVVKSLQTNLPDWLQMSLYLWDFMETVHTSQPLSWVACEGVFSGPNVRVFGELSRIVAVIVAVANRLDIPCFELSTIEIDQLTGVTHAGRKQGNKAQAKLTLGTTKISQDIADAAAVGIAGYGKYTQLRIRIEDARQDDQTNGHPGLVFGRDRSTDREPMAKKPKKNAVRAKKRSV